MEFLDIAGIKRIKALLEQLYVRKTEYEQTELVISTALNDLNTRLEAASNTNIVTNISETSTDDEIPSAKCVYDAIGDIESVINKITWG